MLKDTDTLYNPIVLAVFADNIPRIYILLLETILMILCQTFRNHRGYYGKFYPPSSFRAAERAFPKDMKEIPPNIGLNNAWTLFADGYQYQV